MPFTVYNILFKIATYRRTIYVKGIKIKPIVFFLENHPFFWVIEFSLDVKMDSIYLRTDCHRESLLIRNIWIDQMSNLCEEHQNQTATL